MTFVRELQRFVAELVGTLILVLVHAGLSLAWEWPSDKLNGLSFGTAAIGIGFSLTSLIYAFGDVSGAHLNPNVSNAFFLRGVFPPWRLAYYWVAQFAGGYAGASILNVIFGTQYGHLGSNVAKKLPMKWNVFSLEVLATWILITVILRTANRGHLVGPQSAVAVGTTILYLTLLMGNYGVGSMNLIRTLSVATYAGPYYLHQAAYVIGAQQVGMVLAVLTAYLVDTHGTLESEREVVNGAN
jgi:glycerol uptake facilitator-like aquaporin